MKIAFLMWRGWLLSTWRALPLLLLCMARFFSLAGRILDNRTAHMKEETLEDRLWAKVNCGRRVKMEEQ